MQNDKCSSNNVPCQHVWKIIRNTLQYIVVLELWGKGPENKETMGKICPLVFFYFWWHSPSNWRKVIHCNIVLKIFYAWWRIFCVWKIVGTAFQCIVIFQLQGDSQRTYTNFMVTDQDLRVQHKNFIYFIPFGTNLYVYFKSQRTYSIEMEFLVVYLLALKCYKIQSAKKKLN